MDDGQTSKPLIGQMSLKTGENFFDCRNKPTPNWSTANKKVRNATSDLRKCRICINAADKDIALTMLRSYLFRYLVSK